MVLARSAFFSATLPKSLEWTCSQTMWTSSPQRKGRSAWINFMAINKMITWMMAKLAQVYGAGVVKVVQALKIGNWTQEQLFRCKQKSLIERCRFFGTPSSL